jgi:transcriptional regulator with GAF, ATPase, and Fis domain
MPVTRLVLTRERIERAQRADWTVAQVARWYRVTPSAVYSATRRYGVTLRRTP